MKASRLVPMAAILVVCVAGVWFRMGLQDRQPDEVSGWSGEPRFSGRSPVQGMKPLSSSPSRETAVDEGRDQLRAFLAEENTGELDLASYEKVNVILAQALEWSRKDLMAAAEEMMAGELSGPRRAYLFGGLLNLLSTKDQTGALALYDRAWEAAGFNRNGRFHVYEMVMNLADHDPQQAAEWVQSRRDQLPEEATDVLLEKIRGKAAR